MRNSAPKPQGGDVIPPMSLPRGLRLREAKWVTQATQPGRARSRGCAFQPAGGGEGGEAEAGAGMGSGAGCAGTDRICALFPSSRTPAVPTKL